MQCDKQISHSSCQPRNTKPLPTILLSLLSNSFPFSKSVQDMVRMFSKAAYTVSSIDLLPLAQCAVCTVMNTTERSLDFCNVISRKSPRKQKENANRLHPFDKFILESQLHRDVGPIASCSKFLFCCSVAVTREGSFIWCLQLDLN